jgi:cytochrome P450
VPLNPILSVPNWKSHRTIFSNSFTRKNLSNFVEIFNESAELLLQDLSSQDGKTIDFYEPIYKCTLDYHLKTIMNVEDMESLKEAGVDRILYKSYEA